MGVECLRGLSVREWGKRYRGGRDWLFARPRTAAGAEAVIHPSTPRVRTMDSAALLIFALEIPSLLSSQYRANSVGTSEIIGIAVLPYVVVRLMVRKPVQTAWLTGLLGLGASLLACFGIRQFEIDTEPLANVGLTDFVSFRSRLIHPIRGWVPGECFTVFLLTLPFACAAAVYLWRKGSKGKGKTVSVVLTLMPVALLAGALSLSLSRAVFWSTVLFFSTACGLMAVYQIVALRTCALLLVGALGGLLVILVCESALYPDIFKAYAGSHTSQVRSTQGRLNIWSRSLELMRGHRLWGIGSANTALFLTSSADQGETTGFASRAFSLPIQVLVEKGIIGFALYAAFLFLVGLEFHRGMRSSPSATSGRNPRSPRGNEDRLRLRNENAGKAMRCCFAAGIVAVLFRELTYSSLLEHTLTLAIAFTLAALVCADDPV